MHTPLTGRMRRVASLLTLTLSTLSLVLSTTAAHAGPQGIDVSRWQHGTPINWASVRADNIEFVFIKATEGAGYVNSYYASDFKQARAAGIFRGAYHFARPDPRPGDAAAEARYFVDQAGTHQGRGDLPPVLDLEDSGGLGVTALRGWVNEWLAVTEHLVVESLAVVLHVVESCPDAVVI